MAPTPHAEWSTKLALAVRYRNAAQRHMDKAAEYEQMATDLETEANEIRLALLPSRKRAS